MKRLQYILLISAVVIAAACTKHIPEPGQPDSPSLSRSYIFFEPEVAYNVGTRTTIVTGETLPTASGTAFGVMGYMGSNAIFTQYDGGIAHVYRNGEGAEAPFTYSNIAEWINSTSSHSFYAFYPYSLLNSVGVSGQRPYITYTQPTDQSQMTDILTASLSTAKTPIVTLTFQHRLWALDLTVANTRTDKEKIYNPETGKYDEYDPDLKVKSIKFEFDQLPKSGTLYLDGSEDIPDPTAAGNGLGLVRTYTYTDKVLTSKTGFTLNGTDPFLFLPCGSFKYRLTVEFENVPLGLSYTCHHPSTFVADAEDNPILDNGQIQWHWATAAGPGSAGFEAGKRYSLDVVRPNGADIELKWVAANKIDENTGLWDEADDVEHEFN